MKKTGLFIFMLLMLAQISVVRADFTRTSEGIVKDSVTQLEWQDIYFNDNNSQEITPPTLSWGNAINYCQNLALEGEGWRLPNINELKTIVFDTQYEPSINKEFLTTSSSNVYWSSTQWANDSHKKAGISFSTGVVTGVAFEFYNFIRPKNVRCVRDGS